MTLNTLWLLASEFLQILNDTYKKYEGQEFVDPLPFVDSQYISVGAAGSMPEWRTCGQVNCYIGLPYAGFANQGDAVSCGTPVSAGFTMEILRCTPTPQISPKSVVKITQQFNDKFSEAIHKQSNDILILREASLEFAQKNHASQNQMTNINISVGQIQGGSNSITAVVSVPLSRMNREVEING